MDNETRNNKEVAQWVEELPNNIQEITQTLRNLILEASPRLIEEYKWAMPNYSYKGLVCYLQPAKKHVNLGFQRGNELEEKDTRNLLQGSGKTMRHIQIKRLEDIQPEFFTSLILAAVKLNEE